jgi:hypothetical protein
LFCGSLLDISRFSSLENDENDENEAGWAAIEEFSENALMNKKKVGKGPNLD